MITRSDPAPTSNFLILLPYNISEAIRNQLKSLAHPVKRYMTKIRDKTPPANKPVFVLYIAQPAAGAIKHIIVKQDMVSTPGSANIESTSVTMEFQTPWCMLIELDIDRSGRKQK